MTKLTLCSPDRLMLRADRQRFDGTCWLELRGLVTPGLQHAKDKREQWPTVSRRRVRVKSKPSLTPADLAAAADPRA